MTERQVSGTPEVDEADEANEGIEAVQKVLLFDRIATAIERYAETLAH
ncbi:MAG TPA: hypothetical protein VMB21_15310 [Candidatus Limnocylindria bacterium]|nr:hypothetical protein [Candidatus Limnocylindria bacterium]